MGFYHPATLVKDAQRRGVRFTGVDVQHSDWQCRVDTDGSVRLGLRYVSGLREEVGRSIEKAGMRDRGLGIRSATGTTRICPKCGCDDESMIETVKVGSYFCNTCSHDWTVRAQPTLPMEPPLRFKSVDDLVNRTGTRREEMQTLADIGALASFGYDRREALWQVEKAVRPAGELFRDAEAGHVDEDQCPLPPMTSEERVVADYARSEEHTSELQSQSNLVCRLLLEKKKNKS